MAETVYFELAATIPEVVSYAVGAAGVTLGGIALWSNRRKHALEDRLKISEQKRRLDAKTGLLNYPSFEEEFKKRTGSTQRSADVNRKHGLLLADIDDFKALNTLLTLPVTDKVALLPVADVFRRTVRQESDVVARFGGEEFVALLTDTDQEGALTVSQNMQKSVNAVHPAGKPLGLTVAYTAFRQGMPLDGLMEQLSEKLTEAKQVPGKNQIVPVQPLYI